MNQQKNGVPEAIEVRGARVHNLKNVDVDVPLHKIVGIAGVSGSGKSSLALGVLYAEGSRRYLEAFSTYTRRRMTQAKEACQDLSLVQRRLQTLCGLGLGYLTLGEATLSLSGGEAQRLKLASEMGKGQEDTVFVFDEPTIGLHPLDVQTLLSVFQRLIASGATVLVIEHDLDLIRNADFVIDMGPGGGNDGRRIVVSGTPEEVRRCKQSVTGHYI